jgi:hypothetical protein
MPRIAEIKEMGGYIWVRTDISKNENGSAWWSPAEQAANYRSGYRDCIRDQPRFIKWIIIKFGRTEP